MAKQSNALNRKARFNFHLHDEYVAGMVLLGSEVKSIKASHASISEAFCYLKDGAVFLKNAHIKEYANGGFINHEPRRERKLLLTEKEIHKIIKALDQKGHTLVPLEIYTNEKGLVKIRIATASGKKSFDKREDIKKKDTDRELARIRKK